VPQKKEKRNCRLEKKGLIARRRKLLASVCQRQSNLKPRAFAEFALHFNMPAVVADDAVADGQAEAGALADLFSSEEGIVDFGEMVRLDAAARVAEIDERQPVVSGS
jgi:hypothetical protein